MYHIQIVFHLSIGEKLLYYCKAVISNRTLFLIITLLSFAVAGFLLFGKIDPDSFAYLYIGRGVVGGQDMFVDFADNKGPVLYAFFALLYFVFGNNFNLAILFGNAILDAFAIYFLFRLLSIYGFKINKLTIYKLALILFFVLLYKSFSISYFLGGLYSEQLGMMFLVLSLWKYEKKNYFISGLLFGLSILTRVSFLLFIIIFPAISLIRKYKISSIASFGLGLSICIASTVIYFALSGSLNDFIYNNIFINLQYSSATTDIRWLRLAFMSFIETRIIFVFLYVTILIVIGLFLSKGKDKSQLLLITIIYIASVASTFPGGIFYAHHFIQFMLITFIVFSFFAKKVFWGLPIVLLFWFVIANYLVYLAMPKQTFSKSISEVERAEYIMVVPFYPQFNFVYNKKSPDRYFHGFYLFDVFNKNSIKDIERHKLISKDKLKKTVFMMVEFNSEDKLLNAEYLRKFGKAFKLTKQKVYDYENGKIEIYSSDL